MNTNGTNGNGKSSHNGQNGNGKQSSNTNGSSPLKQITSLQDLEKLSPEISNLQAKPPSTAPRYVPKFDQPVILRQSRKWSRAILWGLMAVTTGTIVWANIAKIEEAVSATGKLEPTGTVKEIQAPVGGVVKKIYVEDGQQVKLGEHLIGLDPTTANAQLDSLKKIRLSLLKENQFYQSQMKGVRESESERGRENALGLPHSQTPSLPHSPMKCLTLPKVGLL
ncbi:MAG: biotin/lipoyl-binding protein [Nostoc sp. DedQUE04]|uniref:biotin/lipoyl-binding protein n=1 Tax=Nostoc sp. DedQUE04 TaxID=3075390 RepID=UPI002AD40EFB|nr:biotin/lipoyl-binding protein [Nostoc sp. DedQUE04]MDZ8139679.1 biotin/lipoyl-binding protein [Nostoc sp. DedQUE04]